jgi:Uma2 family endonuclease
VDYSTFPEDDGEPMAETLANQIQMIDLIWDLHTLFIAQGRPQVAVGGNQLMYYNPLNGREHLSPDVYVSFAVPGPPPPSWKTWEMGGFPDLVFEITSASTWHEELGPKPGHKLALYTRLGVQEYFVYDP